VRVHIEVRVYEDDHGWSSLANAEMTVNAPYSVLYDQDWGDVVKPLVRRTLFTAAAELQAKTVESADDEVEEVPA